MPSRNIIPKQGNAKALRAKRKREPQVHENAKTAIIIKGRKTSQNVTDALKDIYRLKSPDAVMFSKKNDTNPMEDETSAEFLMSKNDCSLFCFGSHNKKRPNNVVLGRTFDGHMLDMIELGLVQYRGLGELAGLAKRVGSKPAFVFSGEKWGREEAYRKLQNLLLDFFRGQVVNEVALAGLDHCVVCTAAHDKVYVRHYHIGFQRSGSKIPAVDLKEMGPSLDLQIRRTSFAAKDLWKASVKKPRVAETRKTKNVSANQFGDKLGRIHLGRQDLSSMKMDFVDINMGCPIDLVCDKGMGAALMGRSRKLRGILAGMSSQLTCPLTVKMRVGWDEKKPNADVVVRTVQREADRCRKRGFPGSVARVMIHGRSRLQRYSKLADWDYVRQVAVSQDPALRPLPVIGNGDILSWRDHEERLEQARELQSQRGEGGGSQWSTCCMLARGALIKPWLPTEVKEKRDWDISSSERLDIYRKFVNFGLEYWGSDQMGVNKTRRFLLEWLSFTCRYIPAGVLEVLPQRINEKPPPFNGRDDLESLMCSLNPKDWIKICEMLLGPAPNDFEFEPKHKASSYAPQAAQAPAAGVQA